MLTAFLLPSQNVSHLWIDEWVNASKTFFTTPLRLIFSSLLFGVAVVGVQNGESSTLPRLSFFALKATCQRHRIYLRRSIGS